MLLLITLTLKGRILISPPLPTGGGGSVFDMYSQYKEDEDNSDRKKRILINDSELLVIVELTLRNFII